MVKVCDYCHEKIGPRENHCTLKLENYDGEGAGGVGHFHVDPAPCARRLADALAAPRRPRQQIESSRTGRSSQKVVPLRPSHPREPVAG